MKLSNTLMMNEKLLPNGKKAFTLAEVLITLSILGVIAALTIPSLVNRYTDSAAQTRLKKAIRDYENMATAYMAEEEATDLTELVNNDCAGLAERMKIVQQNKCNFLTGDGVLWNFTPAGGTATAGTNGTAVAYDSQKGPRYGVVLWTADGVVNSTTTQSGQNAAPNARAQDPVAQANVSSDTVVAPLNGYFNANNFMALSSKELSKGKTSEGKGSAKDALGKATNTNT